MQFLMDPSAEPRDLELPLEFEFAMRKAQIYADEMTWDQLYSAFLNLYQQRFIEITAIKELLAEEGVNIQFDISTELELEELARSAGDYEDEDEDDDDDDRLLAPF